MQLFLLFAFAAMICWGIGDFLLQKSARKTNSLTTLTFVGLVSIIALFPFVIKDFAMMTAKDLLALSV